MEIQKGDIVLAVAGRDKNQLFMVLDIIDNQIVIANGRRRRISKPKKKKLKHVLYKCRPNIQVRNKLLIGEKILDAHLRKAIKQLEA